MADPLDGKWGHFRKMYAIEDAKWAEAMAAAERRVNEAMRARLWAKENPAEPKPDGVGTENEFGPISP